jgi:lipopolysaccharide export system protein LptA
MKSLPARRPRELASGLALILLAASGAAAQPPQRAAASPSSASPAGTPNALQGFSQNHNEPVHISSRSLEVQDKKRMATFLGGVHLTQGDTNLTCQTLIVYYDRSAAPGKDPGTTQAQSPTAGGQQQIRKLVAKGDVVVTQKDQTATGREGVFEMTTNTVTLEGNVVVTQGPNVVRGDRLVVDLTTGMSHVESAHGNGRVEGLFLPKEPTGPKPASGVPSTEPASGRKTPVNPVAPSR